MARRVITFLMSLAVALALVGCKEKSTGPDLSNPKSAAMAFTKAMEQGDVETAKLAANAGGMEVELLEVMSQATVGLRKLGKASEAKFGESMKDLSKETATIDASESLANATVVFDGDEAASLTPIEGGMAIPLRRVEGSWKVDVGALIKGDDITSSIPVLRVLAAATGEIIPLVEAGTYKSPREVREALQKKMKELKKLSGKGIPATAPASG